MKCSKKSRILAASAMCCALIRMAKDCLQDLQVYCCEHAIFVPTVEPFSWLLLVHKPLLLFFPSSIYFYVFPIPLRQNFLRLSLLFLYHNASPHRPTRQPYCRDSQYPSCHATPMPRVVSIRHSGSHHNEVGVQKRVRCMQGPLIWS